MNPNPVRKPLTPEARAKGQFKPGQSGKPRNFTEVKELARSYTTDAIDALVEVLRRPTATDSAKVAAAQTILDRGWGKPAQAVTGEDGGAVKVVARVIWSEDKS